MRISSVLSLLLLATPAAAQETPTSTDIIKGLNDALREGQAEGVMATPLSNVEIPQWGVVVKDRSGQTLDVFGQVPYDVRADGTIQVPGYHPPVGVSLELIPQREWALTSYTVVASAGDVDPSFAPITKIPGAVESATDYLATSLCSMKGRPSQITLSLVVSATGGILFAEASAEAGSEVMWDFANDVCPRYGFSTP